MTKKEKEIIQLVYNNLDGIKNCVHTTYAWNAVMKTIYLLDDLIADYKTKKEKP